MYKPGGKQTVMTKKLNEADRILIRSDYWKGIPITRICEKYGISKSTAYYWIAPNNLKKILESNGHSIVTQKEIVEMQRSLERNKLILKILKESNCTSVSPLDDRLSEFLRLSPKYGINIVLNALNISKGTYHNRIICGHDPVYYEKRHDLISCEVQRIFDESHQCYGSDKILSVLNKKGFHTSKQYVLNIMHELGIKSIRIHSKHDYMVLKRRNVVKRSFTTEAPNQVWVSDITQFMVKGIYYYICVIIDLYSRKVVSHKISTCASTHLVTSTFKKAYCERNKPIGLIFHSDQGSQYTSRTFRELLANNSVVQSFSNPGNPLDNAVAESFFANLKREEIYRHDYRSEKEFRKRISNYMDLYNRIRPHRNNKYKSPDQREEEYYTSNPESSGSDCFSNSAVLS